MGGNSSPSSDDIKSVLSSVGVDADDDRVESLLKELDGKDISEVISVLRIIILDISDKRNS